MMMSPITQPQAQALAAFVATLRPDWDAAGIYAALKTAKDKGTAADLAHAAIQAASTPSNRTPAVIAMAGPHWAQQTASSTPIPGPGRSEPCPVDGHTHETAWCCHACRSEWLETGIWPHDTRHHQATPTTSTPDVRTRAAGDDHEGDER